MFWNTFYHLGIDYFTELWINFICSNSYCKRDKYTHHKLLELATDFSKSLVKAPDKYTYSLQLIPYLFWYKKVNEDFAVYFIINVNFVRKEQFHKCIRYRINYCRRTLSVPLNKDVFMEQIKMK